MNFICRRGFSKTLQYSRWRQMIHRCENPKNKSYKNYGGRGITVCKRWHNLDNFIADMGERPYGMQLERIDNNKNYCPSNCRWATISDQSANKRNSKIFTINGLSMTQAEWGRKMGFSNGLIHFRIKNGWNPKSAITTPIIHQKNRNLQRGSDNWNSKLTKSQALLARKCSREYGAAARLARQFKVSCALICNIRDGIIWKHLP